MEGKQHTVDNERMPRRRRVRSRIFSAVDRVTGKVYSFVIHSLPGRIMTSYRTPEDREEKRGEAGKYRPLSRVKSRMVSVAESSRVVAFFRKLAHNFLPLLDLVSGHEAGAEAGFQVMAADRFKGSLSVANLYLFPTRLGAKAVAVGYNHRAA